MSDPDFPETPRVAVTPELSLDREERALLRGGEKIALHEKPLLLLEALLEARGQVVRREDLYRAVWPDTEHLDFAANLNATVRKLRQTLGDSALSPRWIETVPGRGYRLLPLEGPSRRPVARRLSLLWVPLVLVLLAATFGITALLRSSSHSTADEVLRIGIVRFERTALDTELEENLTWVGESVLHDLTQALEGRAEIIGPRSTLPYEAHPFPRLDELVTELELDYVLNGRLLREGETTHFLVELIRLPDGAHPWVQRFDLHQSPGETVSETVRGVVTKLEAKDSSFPPFE